MCVISVIIIRCNRSLAFFFLSPYFQKSIQSPSRHRIVAIATHLKVKLNFSKIISYIALWVIVATVIKILVNQLTLCRNCYRERNTVNKKMINENDSLGDLNSSKVVINNEKSKDDPMLNDDITNDKNIIEFIKDNMMKEKLWNVEMRDLLESQINYLKTEIIAKNNIIEQLICELSYRNRIGNKSDN